VIDRDLLGKFLDLSDPGTAAIVDLVEPYLPVLKRGGNKTFGEFVSALLNRDWTRIDRALYEDMTEDERDQLSQAVLADARAAVAKAYEMRRRFKDDVSSVLMGLLLTLV
jgi:hypothetical protein